MLESALLATAPPSARRSAALTFAVALHAAAVLAVLSASLWRDEPLGAPPMPVVFAAVPAARVAGGAGGGGAGSPVAAGAPARNREGVRRMSALPLARSLALRPVMAASADAGGGETVAGPAAGVPGGAGDRSGDPGGDGEGSGGGPPLLPGGDIRAPALLTRVEPDYPEAARKARAEGVVILEAVIGSDGAVEDIRLVRSAFPLLDDAARRAVARWRYRPATLNGRPVRVYLTVTVDFRLR